MTYIARLRSDIEDATARAKRAQEAIDAFRAFLLSPKFTGTESDGARKDWISTGDVLAWLSALRSDLA